MKPNNVPLDVYLDHIAWQFVVYGRQWGSFYPWEVLTPADPGMLPPDLAKADPETRRAALVVAVHRGWLQHEILDVQKNWTAAAQIAAKTNGGSTVALYWPAKPDGGPW